MFERIVFLYGEARLYHDDKNNHYIDKIFDDAFWQRYYYLAKNISICFRDEEEAVPFETVQDKWKMIDDPKMEAYALPSVTKSIGSFLSFERRMKAKKILEQAIAKSDAAIIRLPSTIGNQAVGICIKYKKPFLVEVVGDPYASLYYHSKAGRIVAPFEYLRMKHLVKEAPYVVYVSRSFMQKKYPTTGQSIGCPDANIPAIDKAAIYERIKKIEDKKDCYVLGLIGSLNVDYRGHDTLIKVMKQLSDEGIDCKVRFLGGGNQERWIEFAKKLEVEHKVEFSGFLPGGEKVLEWIDNIDILVMPTKVESLGRAVIEAMSRGCPVIGTRTTALSEQLGDDCLVYPEDIDSIKEKVRYMITNQEYAKYCAYENFYRAHKYLNSMTEPLRKAFFDKFEQESRNKINA